MAAKGDNRQVIVRVTVNDNIILTGEHLQRLTIKSDICTQAVTIGNTCAKQLTLETLLPDTLTPQTLKNSKFFVEIGFLGVTNAVNQIDTQLYVNEILGYLYQVNQSAELTFSLVGDDLFVFNEIEGVAFRLRDGKVFAEPAPGVDVAAATFWVPMGVYYTDKVSTKNDYLTAEITAFDGMGLIERISSDPVRIPTGRTADYRLSEIAAQAGLTAIFPSASTVMRITSFGRSFRSRRAVTAQASSFPTRARSSGNICPSWTTVTGSDRAATCTPASFAEAGASCG